MPVFNFEISKPKGLKASDRTKEEKEAINEINSYRKPQESPDSVVSTTTVSKPKTTSAPVTDFKLNSVQTNSSRVLAAVGQYENELAQKYKQSLDKARQNYGVGRNSVNTKANESIQKIAQNVSSYYKRYYGTSYLPDSDIDSKKLMAEYEAHKETYGEDNANIWLDSQFKDIVGKNQPWYSQALNSLTHLIPTIEGGAIQFFGNNIGLMNGLAELPKKTIDNIFNDNDNNEEDLGVWDSFMDGIIDNPITRYGRDVEHAGASNVAQGILNILNISDETAADRIAATKATATKYNPEGIGNDAIVTTNEQDEHLINSATPWNALYSNGFTLLSMLTGQGLSRGSQVLFSNAMKGAKALNTAGKIIKTEKVLEKTLKSLKAAQTTANAYVIPGLVGTSEGLMEGLNTKIGIEQDATKDLDDFYQEKVSKEADEIFNDDKLNPLVQYTIDGKKVVRRKKDYNEIYKEVWDKYKDAYIDSRRQIEVAASKAGQQNFWANSLINGFLNTTLKSGLQSNRVQESLRNSKMFGWAYRKSKFMVDDNLNVTPKKSKLGTIWSLLKEPLGEGLEEYEQSLSNDTFTGAAENNINEFIKARFNGDGTVKIGQTFASDWSAAVTSFANSLTDKESVESALYGAIGSVLGTPYLPGKGYHRDESGKLVQNGFFSKDNFGRSLKGDGTKETALEAMSRISPWRSGLISNYMERKKEIADDNEIAATMTEWLKDPKNREKWDGSVGTASWMTKMEEAGESNDQFSYRKAQMGKAINDAIMLSKLRGTNIQKSIVTELQRMAQVTKDSEVGQNLIQGIRKAEGEEAQDKTDDEIIEKVNDNANKMLALLSNVEKEGKKIDRLIGRVDDDTKQSLIFGKLMEDDFTKRGTKLNEELDNIKGHIKSSTSSSNIDLDEEQRTVLRNYGSFQNAFHEHEKLSNRIEKLKEKQKTLSSISKENSSKQQREEAKKIKEEVKQLEKEKEKFAGLYEKDDKGKRTEILNTKLLTTTLSEQDIMNLDNATRAVVLANGAKQLYNTTHQNRQKVDDLNLQINEIEKKIEALENQKSQWTTEEGEVKKGHNKQVARNNKAIDDLNKKKSEKMKELNAEAGDSSAKSIFSSEQQQIIDNLVQQGTAIDDDFLDKVVDVARLEKGVKDYHKQYQEVLSDPKAFNQYVQGVKYKAAMDLARRRAERVADIEDYKEYAKELNKLTANASQGEAMVIHSTLRRRSEEAKQQQKEQQEQEDIDNIVNGKTDGQLIVGDDGNVHVEESENSEVSSNENLDTQEATNENTNEKADSKEVSSQGNREVLQTNYDKYVEESKKQEDFLNHIVKNDSFTDNDISMLVNAMQYLSQNGVDINNREEAVSALLENDEQGNMGGKFRQWVEEKNSSLSEQQRAVMPYFTSIGQIVNQYVEVLNDKEVEKINKSSISPTVTVTLDNEKSVDHVETAAKEEDKENPTVASKATKGLSLFDIGGPTPESGQFTDSEGTVATDATIVAEEERVAQRKAEEDSNNESLSSLEKALLQVSNPEIARALRFIDNVMNSITFVEDGKNIKVEEKEKKYAKDFLENSFLGRIDTLDDLIDTILDTANVVEDSENKSINTKHIATIYRNLASRLKAVGKTRTILNTPARKANTKASLISSANIAYIERKNPAAWAVKFTNDHAIDEWHRNNTISSDTPIYFITDSSWSAEVMQQMNSNKEGRTYKTQKDMPIVMAVEVESPKNVDTTTAIQIGEKWYQPIGILPSVNSQVSGAERTESIRQLASKEQGIHIITENGNPNGSPLISYISGKNYLTAHHPDSATQTNRDNNTNNNSSVVSGILNTLPVSSVQRLQGMPKEEILKDSEYIEARRKFIDRLSWGEGFSGTQASLNDHMLYTPDDLKHNEGRNSDKSAQPMMVFVKSMNDTKARNSDKTLKDVIEEGDLDEIVTFNSRTERLFNEVVRPLFEHLPLVDKHRDKSARVISQEDLDTNPNAFEEEAQRLTRELNGYDGTKETTGIHGLSDFLFRSKDSSWELKVTAPLELQNIQDIENSESKYVVQLVDKEGNESPIVLGTISARANSNTVNQENITAAKNVLKELLKQCVEGGVLNGETYWQISKNSIKTLNNEDKSKREKSRQNISDIIDDGILDFGGSSLTYDVDGITIKAPISMSNKVVYPYNKVTNSNNATSSTTIGITPKAEGAVITKSGDQVDSNSGVILEEENKEHKEEKKSEELKKAEAIVEKIISDTKDFVLSEDETYYYVTDKNTGEKTKYIRVTSIIESDTSNERMYTPDYEDILNHLGVEIDDLDNVPSIENNTKEEIKQLANIAGKTEEEIKRAIAELRTEHRKTKFEGWGIPSTALGNTADIITRDFFAGELKESYPNITKEVLQHFSQQLSNFKNDLDSRGITIVSKDVMAHGKITITDKEGNNHEVNVAGTLDLFGYDKDGNFYIFDMKTTRNHSKEKLENEKAKWSRQISMYADLLQQTYGIKVSPNNLRIIPINVSYPAPRGKASEHKDPMGPIYSSNENQIKMEDKEGNTKDFIIDSTEDFELRGEDLNSQFQPGYTHFNISWDNLDSQNQDIANSVKEEVEGKEISSAEVITPDNGVNSRSNCFMITGGFKTESNQNPTPTAPPIRISSESSPLVENWKDLSSNIKDYLISENWATSESEYYDILQDPSIKDALLNELKCKGII